MARQDKAEKFQEGDDAHLGSFVAKAAEQVRLVGPGATATVRFCMDGQWFSVTLRMIDEVRG